MGAASFLIQESMIYHVAKHSLEKSAIGKIAQK